MNNSAKIAGIIGAIMGLLGLAIGIYASINPLGMVQFMNSPEAEKWTPIGIIGFVVLILLVTLGPFAGMAVRGIKNIGIKKRLKEVGQKTTATIVKIQDTGVTVNMSPLAHVTVEAHNNIKGSFNIFVSRISPIRPGDQIEIVYDPNDPTIMFAANQIES